MDVDRLKFVFGFAWERKLLIVLTGLLFLLLGEGWMRAPFLVPRLEYEPDKELGGRLRSDQVGYIWLANHSLQSPPVTINADGFRGSDVDWSRPTVVCIGNSDGAGMGVEDDEVWSSVAQVLLRDRQPLLQVVNASHPGHGPYHHAVRLDRILEARTPVAIVVRVTMDDDSFGPLSEDEQLARRQASERSRKIRRVTRFVPYLVNKLQAQLPSLKGSLAPWWLFRTPPAPRDVSAHEAGERFWERDHAYWERMGSVAADRRIPLVFLVHAPYQRPSDAALSARLSSLAGSSPHLHVLLVGAQDFETDQMSREDRRESFIRRFTLRRDLHGNAAQHRVIGRKVADLLRRLLR